MSMGAAPRIGPVSGSRKTPGPCLVYVVRAANDPDLPRAFATALRRHPAGVDCELVLAAKGFASAEEAQPQLQELAEFEPRTLYFSDVGRDLDVYFAAAVRLRRERYCFLNSYSVPLVEGWLAMLDTALRRPGAGMIGATGSWISTRSLMLYSAGLPSAYRGLLPPRHTVARQLRPIEHGVGADGRPPARRPSAWQALRARMIGLRLLVGQEGFPAYHLRTNAFMISHAALRRLRVRPIRGVVDSVMLESGRASMTRQVQRLGLRTLVVNGEGAIFDHEHWDRSYTFCQGNQEGLLVADNRTRSYEQGDAEFRDLLSSLAWGAKAHPGPSRVLALQ